MDRSPPKPKNLGTPPKALGARGHENSWKIMKTILESWKITFHKNIIKSHDCTLLGHEK